MNRLKITVLLTFFAFLTVAVLTFGLQTCNAKDLQTIKVGALLPLTGEWSEPSKGAQKALTIGIDQVNYYLADSGLKLELDIRDTTSNPQKALRELTALSKQGVHMVIGPMSSEEAKTINQFASDHSILLISPSATSMELSKKDNFFRVIPTDWNQVDGLMKTMKTEKFTRFVVAYRDDTFGRSFCEQLQKSAAAYDNEMIGSVPLPLSAPDYAAAVNKLSKMVEGEAADKTVVMLIGSSEQATGVIRNIPSNSPLARMKWLASADIVNSKEFLADKSVAAFAAGVQLEGLSIGYNGIALDVLPFIDYSLKGAAELSPYALSTWDSLWLIAETYRKNPTADIEGLKKELLATANHYRNSFGLINMMDENGDTSSARFMRYQLYSEDNGNYAWGCRGHYVNPVISAPFIKTIKPDVLKENDEIQIGALLSSQGATAVSGQEVQAVLKEAVACFNQYAATRGSGLKLNLLIEDTLGNPQTAALAAEKLIGQGVKTIIGPISSAELAAVEPLLSSHDILTLAPMSTAPSLSKKDNIYRFIMNDMYQSKAIATLLQHDNINNVIVLYRDDVYGQDLAKTFQASYSGNVFPLSYKDDTTDYRELLNQAEQLATKAGKENTAVLLIAYDEIVDIMRLLPGSGLKDLRWYGTDSTILAGGLTKDKLAAKTAEQVGFTALGYSAYGNYFDPLYSVMNYQLSNKNSHPLQESSISAFDALWMVGCAYLENGTSADREKIKEYVQSSAFRGVSGLVAMDENGDRKIGYYKLYRLEENKGKYRWANTGLYSLDYAKKNVLEIIK